MTVWSVIYKRPVQYETNALVASYKPFSKGFRKFLKFENIFVIEGKRVLTEVM